MLDPGFARLAVGARVTFVEEAGEKGAQASTMKVMGKHGLRAWTSRTAMRPQMRYGLSE